MYHTCYNDKISIAKMNDARNFGLDDNNLEEYKVSRLNNIL